MQIRVLLYSFLHGYSYHLDFQGVLPILDIRTLDLYSTKRAFLPRAPLATYFSYIAVPG